MASYLLSSLVMTSKMTTEWVYFSNMTLVFGGLVKDIFTAVIWSAAVNHSHEDILYQPHEHECHIAFKQPFYYRLTEFEDTRWCFLCLCQFYVYCTYNYCIYSRSIEDLKR